MIVGGGEGIFERGLVLVEAVIMIGGRDGNWINRQGRMDETIFEDHLIRYDCKALPGPHKTSLLWL
jgi:hypothetical protein